MTQAPCILLHVVPLFQDSRPGAPAMRLSGSAAKCVRHMAAASAVEYR